MTEPTDSSAAESDGEGITLTEAEWEVLLENIEEWREDSRYDNASCCPGCGWHSHRDGSAAKHIMGRRILGHHPGCKWRALLERLGAT